MMNPLQTICFIMNSLEKIISFIEEHHVMSLATRGSDDLSVCSLFYAFNSENVSFIVASNEETQHIKNIKINSQVAGNILLETKIIGKIQGLQFKGSFFKLEDSKLKKLYFKEFPQAIVMLPTLWAIDIKYFKLTDNRLGFGKKIVYEVK